MVKHDKSGIVYIAIYVDDCLLIGDKKAIEQAITDIKATGFKLKEDGSLEDYLSCEVTINYQERKGWIHQPHLIRKIESNFQELVSKCQTYATPGIAIAISSILY